MVIYVWWGVEAGNENEWVSGTQIPKEKLVLIVEEETSGGEGGGGGNKTSSQIPVVFQSTATFASLISPRNKRWVLATSKRKVSCELPSTLTKKVKAL